jgi:hypothetical protein
MEVRHRQVVDLLHARLFGGRRNSIRITAFEPRPAAVDEQ